ncbi:MAG: DUF5916 domain-containing protein [Gemmatimonadota bacterium]
MNPTISLPPPSENRPVRTVALLLCLLGFAPSARAQSHRVAAGDGGPGAPRVFSGRKGELEVEIPRLDGADVAVDGRLDEPVWEQATVLADFTQYEPVEGIPATEPTEVRVFYTADAIYFGVHAFDSEPSEILAHLGERDRSVFGDDWIRIMLDTFDDQRQAYVFYVNPLGIQTDGLWIEGLQTRFGGFGRGGVSIDFNPDFIWESDGRVTDDGWTAEIRIPYVSLRFREVPVQDWGVQVAREVKRRGFKQSWAPLTKEISSTLAQSGRLVGLRDLRPKRLVEVNPVITGIRSGERRDGTFVRQDPDGDFGLNGRVGVTQNLVLDATYNPDFSQVEADANQIRINERFALFFPEKRAFFLEGTEIFNTPQRLVYTRRIVDPVAGAKLTGKVGAFQVGYIGAVDESPSTLQGGSGQALFNLVRLRRDVGNGSTVGLLYTDRSLTDGSGYYNRLFAGDVRLLFRNRYTLTAQVAGSLDHSSAQDTRIRPQPFLHTRFERSGTTFSWNLSLTDIDPDFRARSGFIPRLGDTELTGSISFTKYGAPGAFLERTSLRLVTNNFFRHEEFWDGARPFEHEIEIWPTFTFRGGRTLTFVLRNGYFRFEPQSYSRYAVQGDDGEVLEYQLPAPLKLMKAGGLIPRLRLNNSANLNGRMFFREVPIFAEGSRGLELQVGPELQLRPTTQLQLSLNHTFSRIWRRRQETRLDIRSTPGFLPDGATTLVRPRTRTHTSVFSTVNLSRLRIQYQYNKAITTRVLLQYDLEHQAQLRDPTTGRPILLGGAPVPEFRNSEFQGQFLLQYQPSPGTIFYIGYTRFMKTDALTYRLGRMNPVEDGLFLKISYLFRI